MRAQDRTTRQGKAAQPATRCRKDPLPATTRAQDTGNQSCPAIKHLRPYSYISFTQSVLAGAPATGAKSSAPRCPDPDRRALSQRQGQRQGQRKAARGTYPRWVRRALTHRRPPTVGASRVLSRETALTGPVRQPQAAAATRQPHPKASARGLPVRRRRQPRRPREPAGDRGPGDSRPPRVKGGASAIAQRRDEGAPLTRDGRPPDNREPDHGAPAARARNPRPGTAPGPPGVRVKSGNPARQNGH
jgi:hypothetical protein